MSLSSADIKRHALTLGFDLCGVAAAEAVPELRFLRDWLDAGYAGQMDYLARSAERRMDVRQVLPAARSVIVAAMVYNTDRPYSTELTGDRAEISRYAWGEDYHRVIGEKLDGLVAWMRERCAEPFEARCYVDTGPVQERVFAQQAGLGWIGKNTCLINPTLGSWLFLSEIVTSLALEADQRGFDQCGGCTLCLEACPTGALVEPHVLDATRCISYLTIELKGAIAPEHRNGVGTHVYGCDICQEVCPWNMRPATSAAREWQPRAAFDRPALVDLWRASDERLQEALRDSAMARAKLTGLRRNVAVAIGNSGPAGAAAALDEHDPASPSKDDAMVRQHVEWARERLRATSHDPLML